MKRSYFTLLILLAGAATPANAAEYADPIGPSCGEVPQVVLSALPECGIVIPYITTPVFFGGGYHGVCVVDVFNANGDPYDDYSFDWIGITGTASASAARPNNCECQKVNDSIHLCGGGGSQCEDYEQDCDTTPILISLRGSVKASAGPVAFDINGDGTPDSIGWTQPGTAFLVLDLNGNGLVDDGRELFGTANPLASGNGYTALSAIDKDSSGWVTASDMPPLMLWYDTNGNGLTDAGELQSAWDQLSAIGVNYEDGRRVDQHGNHFAWKGWARDLEGRRVQTVDVRFVHY